MGWLEDEMAKWSWQIYMHVGPGIAEQVIGYDDLAEASPEKLAAWSRLAMERLAEVLDYDPNEGIISRVVKSYVDEELVCGDAMDMKAARLIAWTIGGDFSFYAQGERLAAEEERG